MAGNENRRKGKKYRKHGRNKRLPMQADGLRRTSDLSRYRLRHHIPAGTRQANHVTKACPIHDGRMTYDDHVKNFLRKQAIKMAAELETVVKRIG